jgi:Xaa-Pro dipeptidase
MTEMLTFGANRPDLYPYPRFSLRERDRRWARVRDLMAREDLAAIVVPPHTGHATAFQANARYLSHCGGSPDADITVVFPLNGEVTVGATSARYRWPTVQDWVTDIRDPRRYYGSTIIERLQELELRGERVGITGLGRGPHTPEGTLFYEIGRKIMRDLPEIHFVDATHLLEEARAVKSQEEIAFLRRSAELVDSAYATAEAVAAPGVMDYVVWAEATKTLLRGGSEATVHFRWASGSRPQHLLTRASHAELDPGDIILSEMTSCYAGYSALGAQPIALRGYDPHYAELMDFHRSVFGGVLRTLVEGRPLGEVRRRVKQAVRSERPRTGIGRDARVDVRLSGVGLGDDPGLSLDEVEPDRTLEGGMVFALTPRLTDPSGQYSISWGDTVTVGRDGGIRLGQRPPGLREV